MKLLQIARSVPEYDMYRTVGEMRASTERLAREFPDLVTIKAVGESREGDPIQLISIGEGERNALVYAGAHGNEATGAMTAEFLSRHLCENAELRRELGYRWHFIKCIDPESMRLNEGWFRGPFTEFHYHANYYRQPQGEQPEYMFPVQYETLRFDDPPPESRALQVAIDAVQPEFMWSLHNADFGGVFCSISRPCESLSRAFPGVAQSYGLPFDLGETGLKMVSYGPGIKKTPSIRDVYGALLDAGVEDPGSAIGWRGRASDYAEEKYGTLYFVVEIPYWAFEAMGDISAVSISRREDVKRARFRSNAFADWLGSQFARVDQSLRLNTPFHRVVRERLATRKNRSSGLRKLMYKDADADRLATRAEHFSSVYWQEHTRQRVRGMFMRMLDAEICAGNDTDKIVEARTAVFAQMQGVAARLGDELDYERIAICKAVGFQAQVGLLVAKAVSD